MSDVSISLALTAAAAAAILAYGGIAGAIGWLQKRALAKPNARSSHTVPTPQGGGLMVVAAAVLVAGAALAWSGAALPGGTAHLGAVGLGVLLLAIVGFVDDMHGLGVATRFVSQTVIVAAAIALLPADLRIVPSLPLWLERVVLFGATLWFVNLFNFMDGIDLISAVETIAVGLGVAMLAALGLVPGSYGLTAIVLSGAMLGFVPWNAPPARLFLGDAGSLPLGFLLAILLIHVAAAGAIAAALILSLYYLADATITLGRRLVRGERIWEAHRSHFYQRATSNGFTVAETVGRIAVLNGCLVALALVSALAASAWIDIIAVAAAAAAVGVTLRSFERGRR